jgi:hypothetical protein
MSFVVLDSVTTAPSAVFTVVDEFARLRRVAGPGGGLAPIGPLQFRVVATGGPAARRPIEPPWDLALVDSSPGVFLSYGRLTNIEGCRFRAIGAALPIELQVTGTYYQQLTLTPRVVAGNVVPRLVNLDPAAPVEVPEPVSVVLHPGPMYPFPEPDGFAVVRGSVVNRTREPIRGATVSADTGAWTDTYLTGRSGQFVFFVRDDAVGRMTVAAAPPGKPSQELPAQHVDPSSTSSFPPFVVQ